MSAPTSSSPRSLTRRSPTQHHPGSPMTSSTTSSSPRSPTQSSPTRHHPESPTTSSPHAAPSQSDLFHVMPAQFGHGRKNALSLQPISVAFCRQSRLHPIQVKVVTSLQGKSTTMPIGTKLHPVQVKAPPCCSSPGVVLGCAKNGIIGRIHC